ncbi:MAG: hypothetical protein M1828_000860 [Chrysothrix sp. TS-e1954]|nr:MAG: hypothetical protein M1828_000860 [Chrysothrix sp. TS-e1954]
MREAELQSLRDTHTSLEAQLRTTSRPLPEPRAVTKALESLHKSLPQTGSGTEQTADHLLNDLVPGLNGQSLSPSYYGFVTGGVTPAARVADAIVSAFDQNVQVHLPDETIATNIEDRALCMLLDLFRFNAAEWPSRVFTTGATAGNIIGLACAREYVITKKLARAGLERLQGEGILSSCRRANIDGFQVLTTLPHSSLGKAANIVGIGSECMLNVAQRDHSLDFDLPRLEELLAKSKTASIVVLSCGEVNTGAFATKSYDEVKAIRDLCDEYGAWLHVDGAFGLLVRALPEDRTFDSLRACGDGLELADSIAGDGHKLLNVPYDCGFVFCRHAEIPTQVFQNGNASYLRTGATDITSPLNIRLENSARFRGLPVYSTLLAYGRKGYATMIASMVRLARDIATYIRQDCPHLLLLPRDVEIETLFICVLFRARDEEANKTLTDGIKASRVVYGSGTQWDGMPATRFAIAKWDVDVERDLELVKSVLKA